MDGDRCNMSELSWSGNSMTADRLQTRLLHCLVTGLSHVKEPVGILDGILSSNHSLYYQRHNPIAVWYWTVTVLLMVNWQLNAHIFNTCHRILGHCHFSVISLPENEGLTMQGLHMPAVVPSIAEAAG